AVDLPEAQLIGVEGTQDVLGILEVVIVHPGTGIGPRVDAGLMDIHEMVVVNVRDTATQQWSTRVDVLVKVVVERDEAVRAVALARPDQPTAARVAQDAVGQRHVLGVVLQVEQAVKPLRLPTGCLQGDVVDPDVADIGLHADGVPAVGGGRARLLDVPDGHVLDDDVAGLADVDAQLVKDGSAADADDRDVADPLELDAVVVGVAAVTRYLAGVAVVDGPLDLNDDRGAATGPVAQGRVDRRSGGRTHDLSARTAGGTAVLGRVAGGAAGRRRCLG